MQSLQICVHRRKSKKVTYADLVKSAGLLSYLCDNNIHSINDLRSMVDSADNEYRKKEMQIKVLKSRIEYLSGNPERENREFLIKAQRELETALEESARLHAERKKAGDAYRTYLTQTGDHDYAETVPAEKDLFTEKAENFSGYER